MGRIFEMSKENNKKVLVGFALSSFFLHIAILVSKTDLINLSNGVHHSEEHVVKLNLVDNSQKVRQQVVQTESLNNNKKTKTLFLGKSNNSVDRETRAANTGKFKTAGLGRRDGEESNKRIKKALSKNVKEIKISDLGFGSITEEYSEKEFQRAEVSFKKGIASGNKKSKGFGQSNDFIEDIPLGDFTKLNTQEFEFYGFYDRIREKLEQFWGRNIQEEAGKMLKTGRSIASDTNHVTALEIEINTMGEIVKVDVRSASGIRELDAAAVDTFNQAGPFPNPPTKMLKNGKARIKWSFVVNT